ncbi:glycosyltransferase family 2 protein [Carboxylicivirga sp. N1Y90]|uniref:glycosyltransferase family 2 protein n=1 Tax=Carboxylicivirga fragile TaxID=3417571 RepID=UPI003D3285A8|nr:glycosyltransferase family 2 protein [Marinilabiliaceae bacterium N1Y90]
MHTISLIISTYNRPDTLDLVLKSVLKQSVMPKEVIIADDGSGNETKVLIDSYKDRFTIPLIHSWIEDKGFRLAKSRNEGIKKASGDFVIFIDGDIILHRGFIKGYYTHIQLGSYMMGSRVLLPEEYTKELLDKKECKVNIWHKGIKNRFNGLSFPGLYKLVKGSQSPTRSVKGANMGFWKKDLLHVNGFDERFTGWGREDSDMAARMMHAGVRRINFKCISICYHLYHPEAERSSLLENDNILNEVIISEAVRAQKGLCNDKEEN